MYIYIYIYIYIYAWKERAPAGSGSAAGRAIPPRSGDGSLRNFFFFRGENNQQHESQSQSHDSQVVERRQPKEVAF